MPLEVEVHANAGNCVTTLRTNTGKIQGSISAFTDASLYYFSVDNVFIPGFAVVG